MGNTQEKLTLSFYLKRSEPHKFAKCDKEIKDLIQLILFNMSKRFGYSHKLALESIIFALDNKIINFTEILN